MPKITQEYVRVSHSLHIRIVVMSHSRRMSTIERVLHVKSDTRARACVSFPPHQCRSAQSDTAV